VAILAFCAGYLIWQVALPVRSLLDRSHFSYGWQMFAFAVRPARFDIVYSDSTVRPNVFSKFVKVVRVEVDYPTLLPPHICATVPDAAAVRVGEREYPCIR
jgi:hypothetical protein